MTKRFLEAVIKELSLACNHKATGEGPTPVRLSPSLRAWAFAESRINKTVLV